MKFLFIDHYYPDFLKSFYLTHPSLDKKAYQEELNLLLSMQFGTADFYSHAMGQIGHQAIDVVVNDYYGQEKWAQENGVNNLTLFSHVVNKLWGYTDYLAARKASPRELDILGAQIKAYRPDVLYVHNMSYLPTSFLIGQKKIVKLVVGQIASPIAPLHAYRAFDLVITSLPHFVSKFQRMKLRAEYLPLCFDPRVLHDARVKRVYPVTFVGSFFSVHKPGITALSSLAHAVPLKIWGSPKSNITDPNLLAV